MEGLDRLWEEGKRPDAMSAIGSRLLDIAPLRLLQDDAIAIWVFVRAASSLPVGIERHDLFEAGGQDAGASSLPLGCLRHVEDHQVFVRGRWRDRVGATVRELEVVARTFDTEHDAVESGMVLEAADNAKAEAATVHGCASREITDWPGDSEVTRHCVSRGEVSSGIAFALAGRRRARRGANPTVELLGSGRTRG